VDYHNRLARSSMDARGIIIIIIIIIIITVTL